MNRTSLTVHFMLCVFYHNNKDTCYRVWVPGCGFSHVPAVVVVLLSLWFRNGLLLYHRHMTGGPELPASTPYCPSVSIWVPDVSHSIIPRSQEDPPSLCGQVGRLQGHSCVPGTCRSVSSQLRAEMRSRDADGKFSLKHMGTQACWVGVTLLLKSIHLKYSCALIKSVKSQGS